MTAATPATRPGIDKANLAVRVGSALVFAVFFFTLLYQGAQPWAKAVFLGVLALAAAMGVHELTLMGRKLGHNPSFPAGTLAAWGILVHFFLVGRDVTDPLPLWAVLAFGAIVIHFGALFFDRDLDKALTSQAITWMGALYMGLGTGFIMKLFMFTETTLSNTGGRLVLALFLITWMGDTTAYFVGSLLGRHKLARRVSPKKSWEGALGNLAGNVAAAFVIRAFVCVQWTAVDAVAIGLLLGTAGQLGDLAESTWKRSAGVKDSNMGSISIPGHGGMLDRLDSLAFAAPVFYAYVHFVHGLN
ncbi:phosphatidate cytidylyltransferase [Mesoterricola sediminis]|uniref:Phosphatidate cytidylyltransferase n=1 Tax=Mesoterricola sediminis TaxID=2927980 RepID=A0AA48GY89_9BACT|nr:phosphatidate cytidylyltransferase [Mesoterricola sediminis]BDU78479.1 phosphatidate cytidylyltransferase [Mesoterricola sediminis]